MVPGLLGDTGVNRGRALACAICCCLGLMGETASGSSVDNILERERIRLDLRRGKSSMSWAWPREARVLGIL